MIPFDHTHQHNSHNIGWLAGNCLERIKAIPSESIRTCVTSPPYYNLRDYGHSDQIGKETTPEAFVENLVKLFREVRRCLTQDGTLWLNIGDSYWAQGKQGDVKPKDLIGIPWMLAFALRKDGWYLRQDIIWYKPNPKPESVKSRCTNSHEYVFLLSKSDKYYYNADAIAEPADTSKWGIPKNGIYDGKDSKDYKAGGAQAPSGIKKRLAEKLAKGGVITRNAHSVWSLTKPAFRGNHVAVMPRSLAERCILAGSEHNDWILDPFGGSGTTAISALEHKRNCVLIELNPEYIVTARTRVQESFLKGKNKPNPPSLPDDLFA